jgi:hypothetical protein
VIDQLDNLLRYLLGTQVPHLKVPAAPAVTDAQIRFDPPDDDFRAYASNIPVNTPTGTVKGKALDVYLVDIRENRHLRSNERVRTDAIDIVIDEPSPARIDCHYLITAWSPTKPTAVDEPTRDEQVLLYEALAVLFRSAPINPSLIYPPAAISPLITTVNPAIRESDLPTVVLPADGFPKLAEFWGAMGQGFRWKPALWLIVTLPVLLDHEVVGEPVTTELAGYGLNGGPIDETRTTIGVEVVHAGAALAGAWVRLETPLGVRLYEGLADDAGHLVFVDVPAGGYVLQARASGLGAAPPTSIQIPSAAGGYRVSFP